MSNDLLKRARRLDTCIFPNERSKCLCGELADRIKKLEAALQEPTLPMLLAGKKSLYSCSEDPEIEDARACFLAMARKALEGKDETIG